MKYQPSKNKGTAVITAMLIVAMVVITTASLMLRLHIGTVNTRLLLNSEQAFLNAVGVEEWALTQIATLYVDPKNNDDYIKWPRQFGPISYQGNTIQAVLFDAQSNLNINNAGSDDQDYSPLIMNLAKNTVLPNSTESQLQEWVQNLKSFIANIPNQHMVSPSELRLFLSASDTLQFENRISALPEPTPININTATEDTLMILHPNMTPNIAKDIVKTRESSGGFRKAEDLKEIRSLAPLQINTSFLTVKSRFFLLATRVDVEQQHLILFSLLKLDRAEEENQRSQAIHSKISVIWHSIDTL